jgi:hypothetical protein
LKGIVQERRHNEQERKKERRIKGRNKASKTFLRWFKEDTLDVIAEDKEAREEICRACEILARLKDKDHAGPCVESEVQRTLQHLSFFSRSAILDMINNLE